MDLGLAKDPYESFRIFQGRILDAYMGMSKEFNFVEVNANEPIEAQQKVVRDLISMKVELSAFESQPDSSHVASGPKSKTKSDSWKQESPNEDNAAA